MFRFGSLADLKANTSSMSAVGLRIPDLQVFEDSFDYIDIVDERDDAHVAAAVNTRKRIDLVHLLNQPCPGGLATGSGRRLVEQAQRTHYFFGVCSNCLLESACRPGVGFS